MINVDHLTSVFSPYNYCFYFLKQWFSDTVFPLHDDPGSRFILSPSDQAFLMRSTGGSNNSELDFPFFSIYPESMKDENDKFNWTTLAGTRRVLERSEFHTIKYQNAVLDFQCVYFTTDGFDEIMRLATVLEFHKKQNITYSWVISTSIHLEGGVLLPIKIKVPIHLMIKDLDLNPVWKERDWLTQNKIFTLDCSLKLQTLKPIIEIETSHRIESIEFDILWSNGQDIEEEKIEVKNVR